MNSFAVMDSRFLIVGFKDKKWFCVALSALFLAVCVPASAQQAKKVHRISYISLTDAVTDRARADALRMALRDAGYIDGKNIFLDYRYAEGNDRRIAELAAELVRLNVDVIVVAGGDNVIRDVMSATKTIPIVMDGQGSDTVRASLLRALPGRWQHYRHYSPLQRTGWEAFGATQTSST